MSKEKLVSQQTDDYDVWDKDFESELLKNVVGQKIEKIFAKHDRKEYSTFKITLSNGKVLIIKATTGDFNSYFDVSIE